MRSTHDHEDHVRYWLTDALVDRNQKSIIVLLNYQKFPSQKLITSDLESPPILLISDWPRRHLLECTSE